MGIYSDNNNFSNTNLMDIDLRLEELKRNRNVLYDYEKELNNKLFNVQDKFDKVIN